MFGRNCCENFVGEKFLGEKFWWNFFGGNAISLIPQIFKNIIFWVLEALCICICLCVCVSLSLSFCKYSSRSLSSPDDKLSENIWFVWSRTSYSGDEWLKVGRRGRCYHGDEQQVKIELLSQSTLEAEFRNV